MKKALLFGISLALALSLAACGSTQDNADNSQDSSKPAVTESVDTSSQTQEEEETTPDTAETPPVSQVETQPTAQSQEETPVSEEVGPKFTEVNETVYATTSVNVRSSYSADSDRVGGLSAGASATRTGVGDNGWSRIVYGDGVAYVNSDYLSTTKPSSTSNNSSSGSSTSTSKPSTSSGSTSKPSTSSGSTNNGSSGSGGLRGPLNNAPSDIPTPPSGTRPSEDDFTNRGPGTTTDEEYEDFLDAVRKEMAGSIK